MDQMQLLRQSRARESLSFAQMSLKSSLEGILRSSGKQFLSVLVTDPMHLQLIEDFEHNHVGILKTQENQAMIGIFSRKHRIVDQSLSGVQIDVLVCSSQKLLQTVAKKNYVKHIYALGFDPELQGYKKYKSIVPRSYLLVSRVDFKPKAQPVAQYNYKQDEARREEARASAAEKPKTSKIKKVDILVPFFNNSKSTMKLLRTIEWYSKQVWFSLRVVLLSDGSSKLQTEKVQRALKPMRAYSSQIIQHNDRLGYIKSMNQLIKKSRADGSDAMVFAHNDVQFAYTWPKLIQALEEGWDAAFPMTNFQGDSNQSISWIRQSGSLEDFPKSFQKCHTQEINHQLEEKYHGLRLRIQDQIDIVPSFFFCALKSSVFDHVKLFSQIYQEGFGQGPQMVFDLLRCRRRCAFVPEVYIPHEGRETFSKIFTQSKHQLQARARMKTLVSTVSSKLNFQRQPKTVVYTCSLSQTPELSHYYEQDFDYVLLGQKQTQIPKPWKFVSIKKLKKIVKTEDPIKVVKFFKTHPHLLFKNYRKSIWFETSAKSALEDPSRIKDLVFNQEPMAIIQQRSDPVQHIKRSVQTRQSCYMKINQLLAHFKKIGAQSMISVRTDLLVRQHNLKQCILFMQNWWRMIQQYTSADWISLQWLVQRDHSQLLVPQEMVFEVNSQEDPVII